MYTRAELPISFILRAFFMLYTLMKKLQQAHMFDILHTA